MLTNRLKIKKIKVWIIRKQQWLDHGVLIL